MRVTGGLITLALLWTLVFAPAFAPLRTGMVVITASETIATAAPTPPESHACACLQCGKKACCCLLPTKAKTASADSVSAHKGTTPVSSCAFRAVCDRATADITLPFVWWTALVPPAPRTIQPAAQQISLLAPPTRAPAASADLAIPETPPRFLS
jgi:hypothetical protein